MSEVEPSKLKIDGGQLLIEAMIAIGIITIGTLAVLGFLYKSISLNRVVSDQLTATYLAAEGIEITKNLIDANKMQGNEWNRGFTPGSYEADYQTLLSNQNPGNKIGGLNQDSNQPILFNPTTGFYAYSSGNPTNFKRTIKIDPVINNGTNEIRVNSIVKWTTRGGGTFEVNLEDHFLDWRP